MKSPFGRGPAEVWTPEFKAHEEYELPFSWGSLHVTQAAHKAYGLVPLTTPSLETDITSNSQRTKQPKIKTHVWLMAPDEMPMAIERFPGMPLTIGATQTDLSPDGIQVTCGFDKTDAEMAERFVQDMEEQGIDLEDRSQDEILQKIHQELAHQFPAMAGNNVREPARQLLERATDDTILKKARRDFLIGVGGAAYIDAAQLLLNGSIDLTGELGGAGMMVAGGAIAYHGVRKYLKNREAVGMITRRTAEEYGYVIAQDIHRTYCARAFDHRLEEMLSPENGQ